MNRRIHLLSLVLGLLLAAIVAACNASSSDNGGTAASGNGASAGTGGNTSNGGSGGECLFCTGGTGQGGIGGGALILTPPTATLDIINGVIVTQNFVATLNGADVTSQVQWGFDKVGMGSMIGQIFTPSGTQGGVGTLTATFNQLQASAHITVNVTLTSNPAGLTPQDQAAFDTPNAGADSAQFVYPYNDTVMPLRVATPEFQWNGGGAGDVYRLRITAQHISYTEYLTAPPPSIHTLSQQQWEDLQFSTDGPNSDPLHVELERKSGLNVYNPLNLTLHIAQGFIYGAIYYWELPDTCGVGNGQIKRIRADTPTSETFFSPGANVCWGCHTVSRDGTQLAAEFNDGNGPLYTIDLAQNPAQYGTINPSQAAGNFIFSAFNDTGTRLLAANNTLGGASTSALALVDVQNHTVLNANTLGSGCGEPAWSPDGTKIAAICGFNSGFWDFDATTGNLVLSNTANDAFSTPPTTIAPQAGGPGRPAYPSFSPDSQYVAYGRPTFGSRSIENGMLYLVDTAGAQVRTLITASNDNQSFNPVFAPKQAGGYNWVVFISRRNYGNQLVGANRQQLWVTALDEDPNVADPSHPPFYVRGQEACGKSENAYYALEPCKADGADCTHGVECCGKSCINGHCGQPVVGQCIPTNSGVCTADTDCCDYTGPGSNVTCVAGFCELKPPQ